MRRRTQKVLYNLLPVVFWLLAIGGSLVPLLIFGFRGVPGNYYFGYPVSLVVLLCIYIVSRILRHASSVEQCFQVSLLLGIASYWLPTLLFVILPIWGYLIYRNIFSFRSFLSSLVGVLTVSVWAAVFIWLGWIDNPWAHFFAKENAWGWIPAGAILIAWLATTIVRQTLRER